MGCRGIQNLINNQGPAIEYQTFQVAWPNLFPNASIVRDFFCGFSKPHRFFFIASIDRNMTGASFFFHSTPLGLPSVNATLIIVPAGNERWVPIAFGSNDNNAVMEGRWFRFKKPIQSFYLDSDHPNGGGTFGNYYNMTIGGTDDIEMMVSERL